MTDRKEYSKQYRLKNKEKIKEYEKQYRLKNKEKLKEYYLKNKEYYLEQNKQYRLKNKEYFKQYRLENKEKIKERKKIYHLKNKEKIKEKHKQYYLKNKEKVNEKHKQYVLKNKEKIKEYSKQYRLKNEEKLRELRKQWQVTKGRIWEKNKFKTDLNFKLKKRLRSRILTALKGTSKSKSTMKLLGCSVEECWSHLEQQFKPGMTKENHGLWHVDHVIPCASFDLTKPEEQKKCFHYTNLQPLWATENMSKGAKYEME